MEARDEAVRREFAKRRPVRVLGEWHEVLFERNLQRAQEQLASMEQMVANIGQFQTLLDCAKNIGGSIPGLLER